jgi:polysaccharide pyruvyl transferase WcaK-like protein
MSVGKSTMDSALSRFFIKWALKLSAYRSYRDEVSKKLLGYYTFTRDDPVFPDLVFSLPIGQFLGREYTEKKQRVVGVSPIAYCDPRVWPREDAFVYGNYIRRLASFVSWLLRKNYHVLFFPTDSPDQETINDIMLILEHEKLGALQTKIINPVVSTVEDLISCLPMVDFVIASRLHAVKISHMLGKPVLAISYERKVQTYMADIGQLDYCVDIDTFELDSLISKFINLLDESKNISVRVKNRIESYEKALQIQFDNIWRG